MIKKFDVAIVGSSLAGASAAIRLGQQGLTVALIDKDSFPRRKPCGEGLSSFGLRQLEQLGIAEKILALPHIEYRGYKLKAQNSRSTLSSPWKKSITIQRSILDSALLRSALDYQSVQGVFSEKVRSVSPNRVQFDNREITAKEIILACGGNSPLIAQVCHPEERTGRSVCAVTTTFKGKYHDIPAYIYILIKNGYEIYCTPLAGDRLNISILFSSDLELNPRDLLLSEALLSEVFAETSFNGKLELPPLGRTSIGNIRRESKFSSIHLAGDVKEEFDPIGGMGMSHALYTGIGAADSIIKRHKGEFADTSNSYFSFSVKPASLMRTFTKITYHTLRSSERFPVALKLAASPLAGGLLKFITRDLA